MTIIVGSRAGFKMWTMLIAVFFTLVSTACAQAKLTIVTSTPDIAAIVENIGGDRVAVSSIAKGYQDPHFVEAKPSYMLMLGKADLYFVTGMSLETGWSPVLEQGARKPSLMQGGADYVDCSLDIHRLEVPSGGVDRSMGDVHPQGNPHYLLDPENGIIVAGTVTAALSKKDPANAPYYKKNRDVFASRIKEGESKWLERMKPLKGVKVVTDHRIWSYFAHRFGLDVVGTIEPKPGISPSPAHVAELIELMKREKVKIIIRTPYFESRTPELVAKNTGAASLVLPFSVGSVSGVSSYYDLFDYITEHLVKAATTRGAGK
jgi:zinc/manganese transport system substrate-binding protein